LEYTSYDFKPEVGLGDQLVQYILSKEYWTKRAWKEIPSSEKGEKQRLLVLRIIAHLRDHEKLTSDNLKTLLRGTRLRKADSEAVLEILRSQKLIKKGKRKQVFLLGKRVFHKN
jgi:hypothetical protein